MSQNVHFEMHARNFQDNMRFESRLRTFSSFGGYPKKSNFNLIIRFIFQPVVCVVRAKPFQKLKNKSGDWPLSCLFSVGVHIGLHCFLGVFFQINCRFSFGNFHWVPPTSLLLRCCPRPSILFDCSLTILTMGNGFSPTSDLRKIIHVGSLLNPNFLKNRT